ncbi:peroxiredoxin-like family protein [Undibacterium sp. TJN25]|uniref:peroxiredoxin-like family protein n=1 Tax=Undibacterium sp. TJN25 TaxID=3413056 RepID=UPI003BF17F82
MSTAHHTSSVTGLHSNIELAVAAASRVSSTALQAGMRAPLFALADAEGKEITLEALLDAGPVVLNFFRGAWCSYGARSLADFSAVAEELAALGASAVTIGPSIQALQRSTSAAAITELYDVDMEVARTYGLTFNLPSSLRQLYRQLGYQPPNNSDMADSWLVPVPAMYLVNRDGVIVLASVELDYRKRFGAASLLGALKAISPAKRQRRVQISTCHRDCRT